MKYSVHISPVVNAVKMVWISFVAVPSFLQDKTEADVERIKATVMLCYGYVTFHSPPE